MKLAIDQGRRFPPRLMKTTLGDPEVLAQHPAYDIGAALLYSMSPEKLSMGLERFAEKTRASRNSQEHAEYLSIGFREGECSFEDFLGMKRVQMMNEVLGR